MLIASEALGIEAASFASGASKDIAKSPTAEQSGAGTPQKKRFRISELFRNSGVQFFLTISKQTFISS
jgi:hypothetical protein